MEQRDAARSGRGVTFRFYYAVELQAVGDCCQSKFERIDICPTDRRGYPQHLISIAVQTFDVAEQTPWDTVLDE